MENSNEGQKIGFNSMQSILARLSEITYEINRSRTLGDIEGLRDSLISYYLEISSELTPQEAKIWDKIKNIKNYISSSKKSRKWIINELIELDIQLRTLARKHGFLTKPDKDTRDSMIT